MKPKTIAMVVLLPLIGAAAGYCAGSRPKTGADAKTEDRTEARARPRDNGERASARALRARIAELERRISELTAGDASAEAVEETPVREQARGDRPGWRPDAGFRENIERMKREDPERYAQTTNWLARMRGERLDRAQSKMDFLSSIDTSGMSERAREVHGRLQDMIERREELEAQMADETLADDERWALFGEMRETDRAIRRLNREERDNLIAETVRAAGIEGDMAGMVSDTLRDIIEATGNDWPGGPGGRRARGFDGPRPARGE